jgi:hypothetical protein
MSLILRLDHFRFPQILPNWWKSETLLGQIFEFIEKLSFADELKFVGKAGSKRLKAINLTEEVTTMTSDWTADTYNLVSDKSPQPNVRLTFALEVDSLEMILAVDESIAAQNYPRVVKELVDLSKKMAKTFHPFANLGPRLGIECSHLNYPRPRPPRYDIVWQPGRIVDFISLSRLDHPPPELQEQIRILLHTKLPVNAGKEISNDFAVVSWNRNFDSQEAIQMALTSRELWMATHFKLSIDPSFNRHGDHLDASFLQPHEIFSYYHKGTLTAYQAVAPGIDGALTQKDTTTLKKWLKTKKGEDGTPFEDLDLVTPDRASAIQINPTARKLGIRKTLYFDAHQILWNPFPEGEWIDSPPQPKSIP